MRAGQDKTEEDRTGGIRTKRQYMSEKTIALTDRRLLDIMTQEIQRRPEHKTQAEQQDKQHWKEQIMIHQDKTDL